MHYLVILRLHLAGTTLFALFSRHVDTSRINVTIQRNKRTKWWILKFESHQVGFRLTISRYTMFSHESLTPERISQSQKPLFGFIQWQPLMLAGGRGRGVQLFGVRLGSTLEIKILLNKRKVRVSAGADGGDQPESPPPGAGGRWRPHLPEGHPGESNWAGVKCWSPALPR